MSADAEAREHEANDWIFGYGSLVFRPAFVFDEQRPAYLPGYARRFWQGSTDHRGVPGAPGRVVTLIEQADARCLGVAYRVSGPARASVMAALDHREKGGYLRRRVGLEWTDGRPGAQAIVYFAAPGNPNYLGDAPLGEIAEQVRQANGPSGANLEYVLRLAESLRALGLSEDPVFALEALLQSG